MKAQKMQRRSERAFAKVSVTVAVPLPQSVEEAERLGVDVLEACQDGFIKLIRHELNYALGDRAEEFVRLARARMKE